MNSEELICIGIISSPHGVQGLVKIKCYSDNLKNIISYGDLYNENGDIINLKYIGVSKGQGIFSIEGVNDRNDANQIKGEKLFVKRKALPKLTNGDVYHVDIIGLNVKSLNSENIIGKVTNIVNYGAGDILEICQNGLEILVPLLSDDIENINFEKKIIKLSNLEKWKNINE